MNSARLFRTLTALLLGGVLALTVAACVTGGRHGAPRQSSCLSHVKLLTLSLLQYQMDYEAFPPGSTWPVALRDYVRDPQTEYQCPADTSTLRQGAGGFATSYTLNDQAPLTSPSSNDVPLIFDGLALSGDYGQAHYRHNGGVNAGFLDGHAAWVDSQGFPGLVWTAP
jgi:prepilin-type processing-associated H-X9-DG protein